MKQQLENALTPLPPAEDTTALIEPRIGSPEEITSLQKHDISWQHIGVTRTVCNWAVVVRLALVKIANPSYQAVTIRVNTVLGKIVPVKAVPSTAVNSVSSVVTNAPE